MGRLIFTSHPLMNNISEYVEVKGNAVSSLSHAENSLIESKKHACTINDNSVQLKIGVTFSNIEIRTKNKYEVWDLAKNLVFQIKNEVEYDLIAWSFPENIRNDDELPGVFTPGVILLAKLAE